MKQMYMNAITTMKTVNEDQKSSQLQKNAKNCVQLSSLLLNIYTVRMLHD